MKKIKIIFILLINIIFCIELFSQPTMQSGNTQIVKMPTATASSLGKYTDIPVSYSTGVPDISIPIYNLQEGNLSLPISLSYHSSGIKVAELASWVGLGWSLNAGGAITRTILDVKDESESSKQGYMLKGSELNNLTAPTVWQHDREADIFAFNFNGYSGKFIVDADGNPQLIEQQDLKISFERSNNNINFFKVTTPNGDIYTFGKDGARTAYEKTYSFPIGATSGGVSDSDFDITTWYLLKVESFDSLYKIILSYNEEYYSYWSKDNYVNTSFKLQTDPPGGQIATCSGQLQTGSFIITEVKTMRLSSIQSSNTNINFVANTTRLDLKQSATAILASKTLDEIEIKSKSNLDYCKKFILEHEYWTASVSSTNCTECNKRLKLNKITESNCSTTNSANTVQPYIFEYEGTLTSLPHRLSNSIDHWGFYNGAQNGDMNVPPLPSGFPNLWNLSPSANRNSDETSMKYGVLKKIIYPTSGYTNFTSEANKGTIFEPKTIYTNNATGFGYTNVNPTVTTVGTIPTFRFDYGSITLNQSEVDNGKIRIESTSQTSLSRNLKLILTNFTTGVILTTLTISHLTSGTKTLEINLNTISNIQINQPYKVIIEAEGTMQPVNLNLVPKQAIFFYCQCPNIVAKENSLVGGLRIKTIEKNDIGSGVILKTNYEYTESNGLISSGMVYRMPIYYKYNPIAGVSSSNSAVSSYTIQDFPTIPLSDYDGYHIRYKRVVEKNDNNGYIEYKYSKPPINIVPFPSVHEVPILPDPAKGKEILVNIYNNQSVILQQSENIPDIVVPKLLRARSFKFTESPNCSGQTLNSLNASISTNYDHYSYNYKVKEQRKTVDGIISSTTYEYGTNHLLPIRTITENSDGKGYKTEVEYSFDTNLLDADVKAKMLALNILTPIKTEQFAGPNNGNGSYTYSRVGGSLINYKLYTSSGTQTTSTTSSFPRPYQFSNLDVNWNNNYSGGGSYVVKSTINSYGTKGNPTNYTPLTWQPETYEWDATTGLIKKRTFLNYVWNYDYYPSTNLVSKITNPDGQYATYTYDALMRLNNIKNRFIGTTNYQTTDITYNYGFTGTTPNNYINTKVTYTDPAITQETRQYFDGLGRELQSIKGKYAPNGNDVIANVVTYDAVGRPKTSSLPDASTSNTLAYSTATPVDIATTNYEASPLNRVSSISSPSGFTTSTIYGANTATDAVKLFKVDGAQNGTYAANTLYKTIVNDANMNVGATGIGGVTTTFKDKLGRTILVRKTTSGGSPADTYYVYDDAGNLIFVIPPMATSGTHALSYQYKYNSRNLLESKIIPDAGKTEYLYDSRDLLVATRDANMTAQGKWLATEYDLYGRVIKTGYVGYTSAPPLPLTIPATQLYTENTYGTTGIEIDKVKTSTTYLLTNPTGTGVSTFPLSKITTTYTYDEFGRVKATSTTNPYGQVENSTITLPKSTDWVRNSTRNHVYNNATALPIYQENAFDTWGRLKSEKHKVGTNSLVQLNGMSYNHRDQLMTKGLNYYTGPYAIAYPNSSSWQKIDYTYNREGWLTKINDPWATATLNPMADCTADPNCFECNGGIIPPTSTPPVAGIQSATVTLRYNTEALNQSAIPSGKVSVNTEFKLIDNTGAINKSSEQKTVGIGDNTKDVDVKLINQSKVTIDKLAWKDNDSAENVAQSLRDALTKELANNSKLNPEAQAAVVQAATAAFATQAATMAAAAASTGSGGYTVKDLFNEQLYYNDAKTTATTKSPRVQQYNGNISEVIWQVGSRQRQSYSYFYDRLSRLRSAQYADIDNTNNYVGHGRFNETYNFDMRGNITGKTTYGAQWSAASSCYQTVMIDNLTYKYDANPTTANPSPNSNKLLSITDATGSPRGFNSNGAATTAVYEYDANGNMKKDPYKGITIDYNYLNLPNKITWNASKYIEFVYDGGGNKWRKIVTDGSVKTVYDYFGGIEYKNGVLDAIYHSEGRVTKPTSSTYRYEYTLKDHLGNGRVYFTDINNDNTINTLDILQEQNYYAFGASFDIGPWYGSSTTKNKYQYNGKELNDDFGLNLNDYGARWYDANIGRWTSVDPLAEKYRRWSPYNYTMNNPIRYIDPDGMQTQDWIIADNKLIWDNKVTSQASAEYYHPEAKNVKYVGSDFFAKKDGQTYYFDNQGGHTKSLDEVSVTASRVYERYPSEYTPWTPQVTSFDLGELGVSGIFGSASIKGGVAIDNYGIALYAGAGADIGFNGEPGLSAGFKLGGITLSDAASDETPNSFEPLGGVDEGWSLSTPIGGVGYSQSMENDPSGNGLRPDSKGFKNYSIGGPGVGFSKNRVTTKYISVDFFKRTNSNYK